MVSRENRVLAAAFALFVAAFPFGAALGLEGPISAVVVVIAIPIVGPNCTSRSPATTRSRRRPGSGRPCCWAADSVCCSVPDTAAERRLLTGLGFFLAVLAYEVRTGYLHGIGGR